nr:acyl-CoA thioesterase [uncultured Capnocytophaga sp.]
MIQAKTPAQSRTTTTDLVLPGETNHLNAMFGGELLARMDRAASIASQRHAGCATVTVSVNHVAFTHSIPVGSVVTVEAAISRAFSTSMEVYIDVWMEDMLGERTKATEAIYTFVAVDQHNHPVRIPELLPETELEQSRYDGALQRRQLSLVLAGKLSPQDATELKALFTELEKG